MSRLTVTDGPDGVVLSLAGTLTAASIAPFWDRLQRAAVKAASGLTLDLAEVTGCDTAGAAMLLLAERRHAGVTEIMGATAGVADMLARVRLAAEPASPRPDGPAPGWGAALAGSLDAVTGGLVTLGRIATALARLPARRRMFRVSDLIGAADVAGLQAIPLLLLLGILIGLILSFQSLVPMRRFGADLFVANLVAVGLVRELGPLLTAVLLAGRSASAFAAELGTMKVNQEIDALTTMGVDPVTMLVLPRLLAAVLVMPVMTVLMELSGLLGMTLVLAGSGIPPVTVMHQVASAVVPMDFIGGMTKSVLFGAAVAAVGCQAGLSTGDGPSAIGRAATAAVVGGIVAIVVLDGAMAVLFYRLGL